MDCNSPRSRKRGQLQNWPFLWCFLARRKIPLVRSPPYGTSPPWRQSPPIQPMSPSEGHKPEKCIDTILTSFFVVIFWIFSLVIFGLFSETDLISLVCSRSWMDDIKNLGLLSTSQWTYSKTWTWAWTYIFKRGFIIIKQWSLIVPDNFFLWFSFRPGNLI